MNGNKRQGNGKQKQKRQPAKQWLCPLPSRRKRNGILPLLSLQSRSPRKKNRPLPLKEPSPILMFPLKTRKLAAWGLILLLIAVFPANIYMALQGGGGLLSPVGAWVRLPFQFVFIAWVRWHTND